VTLHGEDVTGRPPHDIVGRGLALIPGGRGVFRDMTVAENLDVEAYSIRRDPARVRARTAVALETFPRLAERLRQPAGLLSGGEQQQLALAKALIVEPSLLCIDELSLGLAPIVVEALLEAVRDMNRGGASVIVVEQSMNVAASICGRAVFMEKGEVRFEGDVTDLLAGDDIARAVFFGGDRSGTEVAR
jgi:ABC-type branched-subunit amino acid transport system ATPase component